MITLNLRSYPIAPQQAKDKGLTRCTYYRDFKHLGAIDVNNTKDAGYDLYTHSYWPNAAGPPGSGWNAIVNGSALDPSTFSLTDGVLTVTPPATVARFFSAAHSDSAPGYVGRVFSGSFYLEVDLAFTPATVTTPSGWIAVWMVPIEFLVGTDDNFVEIDIVEMLPAESDIQGNIHQWDMSTNNNSPTNSVTAGDYGTPDTDFHKYGGLRETMSDGGGTGTIRTYYDDVLQTNPAASFTTGQTYSVSENHNFVLIINIGGGVANASPLKLRRIAIWQKPL